MRCNICPLDKIVQTIIKNELSSDLDGEMSLVHDITDVGVGKDVVEKGLANLVVPFLTSDDSEKFGLFVGVQGPRIVIESEEAVAVELSSLLFGLGPFLVEDECLLS